MSMITLSEAALAVLRLHVERDDIRIDSSNREAHRELARAGLMEAIHTFAFGRESRYRFTKEGRDTAMGLSIPVPSPAEFACTSARGILRCARL
jgi:hypothetical protein